MRIGIDIDDTITNSYKEIFEQIGKYYNVNSYYLIEEGYKYEDVSRDNENFPNYINFCRTVVENLLKTVSIKHGAKEIIKKLQDEGNEIILITARDYEEFSAPYDITRQFLKDNNISYNKLYIGIKEKGRFCRENNIDVLIDDSITHCRSAKENNIPHLLLDNTFNRDVQGLDRVYGWYDTYNALQNLKNAKTQES